MGSDDRLTREYSDRASATSRLLPGVELFNSGCYWEAHEVWEEEWTPDRKGPDSGFYKGLVHLAARCLQYTRRDRRGASNRWRSRAGYLPPYLPAHHGMSRP